MALAKSKENILSFQPKAVELVYEPERIKVLLDETRKHILRVLGESDTIDLNVTDISDRLGTNPQRIYHHVDKLVEFNFLTKTREERKVRSVTSYYARTAQAFIVSYSTTRDLKQGEEMLDDFKKSFSSILQLDLNISEEKLFGTWLTQLIKLSEEIFSEFSAEATEIDDRRRIEHLYFLLEYFIFYTNPEARMIMEEINKLIIPKITNKEDQSVKTVKF